MACGEGLSRANRATKRNRTLPRKHVLVLNQFAMPRTEWGLTRNAELFGRLPDWTTCIVAANRDHYGQTTFTTTDPLFRLVSVPSYTGAGARRIAGWGIFAVKGIAIGLTRRRLDVVYGSSPHLLAAVAAWVVSAVRRRPFVMEVRDLWPESIVEAGHLRRGSALHRALVGVERLLYARARRIVVVTPGWETHFAELGIDLAKVVVVPNGSDPTAPVTEVERERLRTAYGISGFTAVYAGAHGPANGLDQVLDAAHDLGEMNFILIGSGAEKARLERRVATEHLDNVTFRDPIARSELGPFLAACDVGIHVLAPWQLLANGLSPNKVFDYLAAGLPIVSNCRAGLASVAPDGEVGRLGEATELADCLRDVVQAEPERRAEWSTRARELVAGTVLP